MTPILLRAPSHSYYMAADQLKRWANAALPHNPRTAAQLYIEAKALREEGDAALELELGASLKEGCG